MNKIQFETIDSTNSYLKRNYLKYDNYTFVSCDYQEKGHGRNGRVWFSDKKESLLFSILIKDKVLISKFNKLSLFSAVCVFELLKEIGVKNISIKWPNDVFVNNKKIAGILLESVSFSNKIEALVIGIGINVNSLRFNSDMLNEPTSIKLETNQDICLEEIKEKIYNKLMFMFENIDKEEKYYLEVIKNNNYLKGKDVCTKINNEDVFVNVFDINDDCSLKVRCDREYSDLYSEEITLKI